jgi:ferrous iron transport protein A
MTLYDGKVDGRYIVEEVNVKENITRRLEALGINEGTTIEVLNRKKKGAMVIKVRGTRLALGKSIVDDIIVKEAQE